MISSDVIEQAWDFSAKELQWNKIPHFTQEEFNGKIETYSGSIILSLSEYREVLKKRIVISPANWGKHSKKSWHYQIENRNKYVQAIDIFPRTDLAYAWLTAIKTGLFKGIGVYPYWSYSVKRLVGGLHLDTRKSDHIAMWWCDKNKKYHYFTTWKQVHSLFMLLLEH